MSRPTISACLVVYNEEGVIRQCLQSISTAVDEIILVHDGKCTDKTLDIAKEFGAKIFVRPHKGEAEMHRVFTIEQATSEWLLYIDADEFLSPELAKEIPNLISDTSVDAYSVVWPLWDGKKAITENWPYRPILFRKTKLYYLAFPHEGFRTSGVMKNIPLILEHRPSYNNFTLHRFVTKWLKWAKIHAHHALMPFSEIEKYQWPETDWSPRVRFARDFSFLFLFYGIAAGLISLICGAWRAGWYGWKQSIMWGAYIAMVYWYVTLYKITGYRAAHS